MVVYRDRDASLSGYFERRKTRGWQSRRDEQERSQPSARNPHEDASCPVSRRELRYPQGGRPKTD